MKQYLKLLKHVLTKGEKKSNRTGIGTLSIFGYQMRFNLQEGLPLITTKTVHIYSIIHELLWFLKGETNIKYLKDNKVNIWNAWANKDGNLGPIYGKQWRKWKSNTGKNIDQIANIIQLLKNDPCSRRMIVSAWNVGELEDMSLAPCHILFQFYIANNKKLSCQLYQRSCDIFLGLPFNIASYAILTHMIAQQCNLHVGEFIWTGGDIHLYNNHIKQANIQLIRKPYPLPYLFIKRQPNSISDYHYNDFEIRNYHSHSAIKAPIAI